MIYRSVRVLIQNNTSQPLVVGGAGVLRGDWSEDEAPTPYQVVEPNQTQTWQSESDEVGVGTEGYVRLGTTYGWINLGWSRPWVGALKATKAYESKVALEHLDVKFIHDEEEPMSPVVVFMISSTVKPRSIGKTIEAEGVAQDLLIEADAPARSKSGK